jgi:hypothetical protein
MNEQMDSPDHEPAKVVVHNADGTVLKGYMESAPALELDVLLGQSPKPFPKSIALRAIGTNVRLEVDISNAKAVFFVKTFEGRRDYNEVKFFVNGPSIQGIWVQVRFKDNEYLEGVIHNSMHHLVDSGFFLKPPDPNSNNEMVYILKSSIVDYRVLGVRTTY